MDEHSIYPHYGDEPFHRLVDGFYARVEQEPLLRPMYPDDLASSREHLFLFLVQYFGGPQTYMAQRGHPRLRMRHVPFVIGEAERDAWYTHMTASLAEAGFAPDAQELMRSYFERAATFLINRYDSPNRVELIG